MLIAGHDSHSQVARRHHRIPSTKTSPSSSTTRIPPLPSPNSCGCWLIFMSWTGTTAWTITQKSLAYTNHTLLPEALEKWPLPLFASFCRAISRSFTKSIAAFLTRFAPSSPMTMPACAGLAHRRERPKYVRMANLATVGSHAVNGVAALHSELLKKTMLHDFYELCPGEVLQRHQRCHPAPLARAQQPGAVQTDHQQDRRRLAQPTKTNCASWNRSPKTPNSVREWRDVKHACKQQARRLDQRTHRHHRGS